MRRTREAIRRELEETRDRLAMYLAQEARMLSPESVQMYTIGSRSLQRYQLALGDVRNQIKDLQKRQRELEAELAGQSARRAVSITPRDW